MKSGLILMSSIVALFFIAGGVGYLVSVFNSLIQVKNNIGKAWHNIDVLLIQRNEELPKLIDATKSYARFERNVLESLTQLRTMYTGARRTDQKTKIENELSERIQSLKMVWERYPDIKANEVFMKTQERISDLEGSITDRRAFFNETVKIYNIQREQFPQLIFASLMGFKAHPYLNVPSIKKEERDHLRLLTPGEMP